MTRLILILTLCAQVLAANAAFASPRCAHMDMMDMSQMSHASGAHDMAQNATSEQPPKHCKCFCDIVGHCAAAAAGLVAAMAPATVDFSGAIDPSSTLPDTMSSAHKNRLYRPPSSI